MAKVAVVVPVYKVPFEYLDQCLDSIIHQTYSDLEIIIVDDGSPEEWAAKCDSFRALDDRIKVFHKKNGGLSDARNYGLNACTSEWITFVDGDDWIEQDFLESFIERITNSIELSDVYYFSGFRNFPQREVEGTPYFSDEERFTTYQQIEDLQTKCFSNHISKNGNIKGITISSAWAKVYNNSFLKNNHLLFPIVPYDEDSLFYLETLEKAHSIEYVAKSVYHYRYTEGSIVNRYRPDAVKEQEIYLSYIYDFSKRNNKSKEFNKQINMRVYTSIMLLIKQYFFHPENKASFWEKHNACKSLLRKEPYFTALKEIDYKMMRRNPKIKILMIKMHMYSCVELGRRFSHRSITN